MVVIGLVCRQVKAFSKQKGAYLKQTPYVIPHKTQSPRIKYFFSSPKGYKICKNNHFIKPF